jgi:N-acetylglucosaminyldiphosphoundecaprenol N-acetyl-beta-D-mannosaminyltransferase
MNRKYFKIEYELDKGEVLSRIDHQVKEGPAAYVCVADGVILNLANQRPDYLKVINGSLFSVCDSSYVPLYLKWIYGLRVEQYCGTDLFRDIIALRRYRMAFLGGSQETLDALRKKLTSEGIADSNMLFMELPFRAVEAFDYEDIANLVKTFNADIIWVSLGAPKQEQFMSRLTPHLHRGVAIAVGAAFKFYSGVGERRAPQWMLDMHLEFVYRLFSSPRKQLRRCAGIVSTLPKLLWQEWRRKNG